ncbi:MAG: S1C family serine protease, partial [Alphaproteobacteria bacterium]
MEEQKDWEFPEAAQPNEDEVAFELDRSLSSLLLLRSKIAEDGFTASILGTERAGNGVVIGEDGLVLTIGYLIVEAEEIWLTANDGSTVPAHLVGYDQGTGFGLVQALGRLGVPAMALGTSESSTLGDDVIVAGHGGRRHALMARVVSKQEFAGYWEYVLDEAIFTAPAHPNWGGAALIGLDGKLQGIGSLFLQQMIGGSSPVNGNMIVPIDLLLPILDDLVMYGRVNAAPRPWLGVFAAEEDGKIAVVGLASGGPAQQAGLRMGDVVLQVAGRPCE